MSEATAQNTRIVEQASELFRRYGVRSVTMDDLANRLSISKKTIYQHFKDKKEMVKACTQYMMDKELADLRHIEQESKDVMHQLALLSKYFRQMLGQMNPSLLFDLKKYHPQAWQVYLKQKDTSYLSQLRDCLNKGKEEELIRNEVNVEVISRMRMEVVEMGFDPEFFDEFNMNMADLQMDLFDHFVHGVATEKGRVLIQQYLNSAE